MKALIIDGNSLFHRAFHATSTQFNKETKKWESIMPFFEKNNIKPNNATKLCLFWFLSIVKKNSYDYFITCWDCGLITKRSLINKEYKANRVHMPEEMRVQINDVKEIIEILGGTNLAIAGIEADDIGGTLTKIFNEKNIKVDLYSSDKDWMQLINKDSELILVKNGGEKNWVRINEENFKEKTLFPFLPCSIIDFKVLFGDSSDNYKGPLGEKTTLDLLEKYQSIENIKRNLAYLPNSIQTKLNDFFNNKEKCEIAFQMAKIDEDIREVSKDICLYTKKEINFKELNQFINKFNFKGFEKHLN